MAPWSALDSAMMQRAIALAQNGEGYVEPNPMVGCVIVRQGEVVGEGWHQRFGGPHAEIEALRVAGERARGATMYVNLEPCCHEGKTPPCTRAIIAAGVTRVVAAMRDPFPKVAGGGFAQLNSAGLTVEVGLHESEAEGLNAPYLKLLATGRPWVIAKWAMTLDGKIATAAGDSKWISGEKSRQIVHRLRGRVDAVVVGRRTAELDDPLLTARLVGEPARRVAVRIVLDSGANLSSTHQLVGTAREVPTLIAAGASASDAEVQRLRESGCEVLSLTAPNQNDRLKQLLNELGQRRMTNVLVEGGEEVVGTFFDTGQIDEAHVFIAPKLLGGREAVSPIGGAGIDRIAKALVVRSPIVEQLGSDLYVRGRLER